MKEANLRFRSAFRRGLVYAGALLVSVFAALALATVGTIHIGDTDHDSISISGVICSSLTIDQEATFESYVFSGCSLNGTISFGSETVAGAFKDPSGIVSDTFLFTITNAPGANTATWNFDFESCDGPASCGLIPPTTPGLEPTTTLTIAIAGSSPGSDSLTITMDFAAHASTVPEPATLALLGIGLAGLGFSRRKRNW